MRCSLETSAARRRERSGLARYSRSVAALGDRVGAARPDAGGEARAVARIELPAKGPRVSVVIPAKNEARNLPSVLAELPAGLHEVVLVDGGSIDGTAQAARDARPDVRVIRQTRRGKGNALVCGITACTGDVIVLMDADGSADPGEIADFVAALAAGADVAKGSRFLPGGGSADITVLRRWGNAVLCAVMNRVYRTEFSDLCYGYNAFWRHCVEKLALPETAGSASVFGDGFEIETVLAAHVATARLTVAEVPSYERARLFGTSNLNTWRDGWRVLRAILRERRGGGSGSGWRASVRPVEAAGAVGRS
jgi:glycosyltransferase involved in cell wall biosynthesis